VGSVAAGGATQWLPIFVGVPCYPIFRRFNELFAEQGGAFVSSTYLWFASGGTNLGYEYDLTHLTQKRIPSPSLRASSSTARRAHSEWNAVESKNAPDAPLRMLA